MDLPKARTPWRITPWGWHMSGWMSTRWVSALSFHSCIVLFGWSSVVHHFSLGFFSPRIHSVLILTSLSWVWPCKHRKQLCFSVLILLGPSGLGTPELGCAFSSTGLHCSHRISAPFLSYLYSFVFFVASLSSIICVSNFKAFVTIKRLYPSCVTSIHKP